MRKLIGAVALAAVALSVVASAALAYSNGFESDTLDWSNFSGTINQRPDGYANPAYADGIDSAAGDFHARLDRGTCGTEVGGGGNTVRCSGPFTRWGGYGDTWNGPYQTQVDIYLDAAYANNPANEDSYGGNMALLAGSTNPDINGTRFDYTSAINDNTGAHLRDFGFVVGTGQSGSTCTGWVVNGQTNVNRINAFPDDASKDPECITESGWYTFKHSFYENAAHNLEVRMEIFPVGGLVNADWTWTIESADSSGPDHISTVGCNRYGWFSNQEIFGLPIDNASMTGGCAAPTITDGQILPTGTTCQAYDAGTNPLGTVQYTVKGGKINSVAPGVFFYYGTISGTAGQPFTITQTDSSATAPSIPVQHGQVILYDTNCNVLKWNPDSDTNGVVAGTLPSTGTFIISVKYSASDLKGVSDPGTVTYTIDGATVTVAKK